MPRRQHIPLRTCVACGRKAAKGELVRIVRTPAGAVLVDPRGKTPGRGSYLCPQPSCWEVALKKGRLAHGLRGPVPAEAQEALWAYARTLEEAHDHSTP